MTVFWVVAPCSLIVYRRFRGACYPHWNVGKLLPDYMAHQPRRQSSSYSSPWEPVISPDLQAVGLCNSYVHTLNCRLKAAIRRKSRISNIVGFPFVYSFFSRGISFYVSAVFNLWTLGEKLWFPYQEIRVCCGQGCNDTRNPFCCFQITIGMRLSVTLLCVMLEAMKYFFVVVK
jgi:hypothetical protein